MGVFYKEMHGCFARPKKEAITTRCRITEVAIRWGSTIVINIYVAKQQIMCPVTVKLNSSKESDQITKK